MIVLFIFAVIGLTHILVDSEIMEPVEEVMQDILPQKFHNALFNCYQCSGFWCGLVLAPLVSFNPFVVFACGCAGSFLADFSESCFHYLEKDKQCVVSFCSLPTRTTQPSIELLASLSQRSSTEQDASGMEG